MPKKSIDFFAKTNFINNSRCNRSLIILKNKMKETGKMKRKRNQIICNYANMIKLFKQFNISGSKFEKKEQQDKWAYHFDLTFLFASLRFKIIN